MAAMPQDLRASQRLELLASRAQTAALVASRPPRREGERLEGFREHRVKIGFRSDTDRDMRVELLAGCDRREIGDVVDQSLLDVATSVGAHECGSGSGPLCERRNRIQ